MHDARGWRVALLAVLVGTWTAARPLAAQDDDGDFGSHVFEGEPAAGRPLEGVPDESRQMEAQPGDSMPLGEPVDSQVTDSAADDGLGVDPGPREMIGDDDDASAGGSLREAEPAADDGVEPGPGVEERVKREPGY